MTSFLLLLSFLIHLILFIAIYHLYERVKRDKNEQTEQIERLLSDFMNDIRFENKKFEQRIHENSMKQQRTREYIPPVSKEQKEFINKAELSPTYENPKGRVKEPVEDVIETSLEGQVLQLFQSGKSVEQIAKQLNRGKTEIDLLIKLNKQAKS